MKIVSAQFWAWLKDRVGRDQRGEGVISAAIAVLVMAFLGVGMWAAFNLTFSNAERNVDNKVNNCIGQSVQGPSC